jgi:protein-S-isoprenylcysteine O-methyltransferase Ste14
LSDLSQSEPTTAQTTSHIWARIARRIRVPLGFAFAIVYIWLSRPTKTSLITGVVVMLPGLILRGFASGHVQKDKELTTSGPYAYTRNPLYLGSVLLAAGFAVAARNWWIILLMLLMFGGIYIPVIAGEERYLRQRFPGYDNYAKQVPRMLPRVSPYRSQVSAYSSARYWKHREYEAGIGCAVMLGILIAKLVW